MNLESLETKLIRQQNLYIRTLEEQLAVCEEKNKVSRALSSVTVSLFPPINLCYVKR